MEFILGFILFLFAAYISFYIPGKLVLSRIFSGLSSPLLSFLSWPVGISIFLLGIYCCSWIHMPYACLACILGVVLYAGLRDTSLFRVSFGKLDIWSIGIIVVGSLAFVSLTAFSFITTDKGIQFIGSINVIDGLLHIANIKNFLTIFPPFHIGLSGIPLRGYHYFYDLMISRFVLFYHFRPEDLYYRYFSFFISILYGAGFYLFSTILSKNKISTRAVLFFAYFSQSFAFVLSFFVPSIGPTNELGSIYPLELILNPAIILSIGMLLCAMYLFLVSKPSFRQLVFVGVLFGVLMQLKVYAGIIGIGTFLIILLYRFIVERKNRSVYIVGGLTSICVSALTYFPNNLGAGGLWYSPFFAYSVYMQEAPFVSWHWETKRIIFMDHHNVLRVVLLYLQAIGLFWFLSLGSRIIALLGIPFLFTSSFWKKESNIVILLFMFIPFVLGTFFVQSVSIFDIKQFFWIAGCLIALPAGIVLGHILTRTNGVTKPFIVLMVLALSAGGLYGQISNFVIHPNIDIISNQDMYFLEKVEKIVEPKSTLLFVAQANTYLSEYPFSVAPIIAAMTGHATYFEPEDTISLGNVYTQRKNNVAQLIEMMNNECRENEIKQYLSNLGISYIISSHECLIKISPPIIQSKTGLSLFNVKAL